MRLAGLLVLASVLAFAPAASAQQCSSKCDINGDGTRAGPGDYLALLSILGKGSADPAFRKAADLDDSGSITTADFSLLLKFCPMDGADD